VGESSGKWGIVPEVGGAWNFMKSEETCGFQGGKVTLLLCSSVFQSLSKNKKKHSYKKTM
jgi:hypothetical protein